MTAARVVALVTVLLVGGGIAWTLHAAQREQAARHFTLARIEYVGKASQERLHGEANRLLVRLGRRNEGAKPSDEDMRVYNEARDAERAYINACKRCASAAECEQDRRTIASGRISIAESDTYNPCE